MGKIIRGRHLSRKISKMPKFQRELGEEERPVAEQAAEDVEVLRATDRGGSPSRDQTGGAGSSRVTGVVGGFGTGV